MRGEQNKQLVNIIGRRLRESCRPALDSELPPAMARQLALLRGTELSSCADADESDDDAHADPRTYAGAHNDASATSDDNGHQ